MPTLHHPTDCISTLLVLSLIHLCISTHSLYKHRYIHTPIPLTFHHLFPILIPSRSQHAQLVTQFPPPSNRLGCLIFNDVLPITLHIDWSWVKRATPYFLAQPGVLQAVVKILGVTTR